MGDYTFNKIRLSRCFIETFLSYKKTARSFVQCTKKCLTGYLLTTILNTNAAMHKQVKVLRGIENVR